MDVARIALILIVVGIVCINFFRTSRREHRGRRLLTDREAAKKESRSKGAKGSRITWGGVNLPREAETSHFLAVGTTGSGKSLTINNLMRQALRDAQPGSDVRALVYDSSKEIMPFLSTLNLEIPVVILNPFDKRCAAWDMASDVTGPATALQIAASLIPEERGGSGNPYFSDTARDLLKEVMLSFSATGEQWGLSDVLFTMRSPIRLEEVLAQTEEGREVFCLHSKEPRAFYNVLSTARSRLAPFEPAAAAWSRASHKVSLRDWANREMVLVLSSCASVRAAGDVINRLIFQRAAELLLDADNSWQRRSWMVLDEVREAGKLQIGSLMNQGRKKGVCAVIGFQDTNGLKSVYTQEVALEILGQCSHKAIFRLESGDTAKWAAETIGQYEEIQILESHSHDAIGITRDQRTKSEQRVTRDVVMPSEFLSIPPTTLSTGLTGYYLTPFVGVYRRLLPLKEFLREGCLSATDPGFLERSESDQYLEPWTRNDLDRLGLSYELLQKESEERQHEPDLLELVASSSRCG